MGQHQWGLYVAAFFTARWCPLKAPVSGTAMGLIKEGKEVRILTDIRYRGFSW